MINLDIQPNFFSQLILIVISTISLLIVKLSIHYHHRMTSVTCCILNKIVSHQKYLFKLS